LGREKRKRCSRDLHGRMRRESEKNQRRPRVKEKNKEQFSVGGVVIARVTVTLYVQCFLGDARKIANPCHKNRSMVNRRICLVPGSLEHQ
jgi:hypothetical protein